MMNEKPLTTEAQRKNKEREAKQSKGAESFIIKEI